MSEIICVTDRKLCGEDFLLRLRRIAEAQPKGIILREKDLPDGEYFALAAKAKDICDKRGVPMAVHGRISVARTLGVKWVHFPLAAAVACGARGLEGFYAGASCHSSADVENARKAGCKYAVVGHIFPTLCKKDLPCRGLEAIRRTADILPVYAIGGITAENYASVRAAGAAGACVMSGAMTCPDPEKYFRAFGDI